MAEKNGTRRKFVDNLILFLIIGCVILVFAHQALNVIDSVVPEPTPTRPVVITNQYIGDGEIKDEDILDDLPTPTPQP